MIDLTLYPERRERVVRGVKERGITIPTFSQMKNPALIPYQVKSALAGIGLWEVSPHNLFRISWKNEPVTYGGGFGQVNFVEFPPSLTWLRDTLDTVGG